MQHKRAELADKQQRAVAALVSGETVKDAARDAGVNRSTVHRWLKEPDFMAALNGARRRLRDEQEHRLMALGSKAISTIASALDQGDTKAAFVVVKGLGLLQGEPHRIGPDDPDVIRRRNADAQMWAELMGDGDRAVADSLIQLQASARSDLASLP